MPAPNPSDAGYKDEDYLRREYVEKGRTAPDLSDEHDVTHETILYWLRKFGIEVRSRGARSGKDHHNWKGGPQTVSCVVCGGEFEVTHYQATNDLIKCCSKDCRRQHLSEMYTGEGNPQYGVRGEDNATHGRTGEAHPMYDVRGEENPNWQGGSSWRDTPEWAEARAAALKRDGSSCQECGLTNSEHVREHGSEIHVHHRTAVSDGGAKFDPDNLVTLCADCHSNKHGHPFPTHDSEE